MQDVEEAISDHVDWLLGTMPPAIREAIGAAKYSLYYGPGGGSMPFTDAMRIVGD